MNKKKAQSTLEYILLLVVVLLAIIAAIGPESGPMRKGVGDFFGSLGDKIGGIMDEFE